MVSNASFDKDFDEVWDAMYVIATDPDCDRLGVAIRNYKNELQLLNGNQTMLLMTDFLLKQWESQGKITGKEFIASTIVSTPMLGKMALHYGVESKTVLTGFKWIAKLIKDNPELSFIGGGEESFGYMVGDFVRDKDAVTSTLLAVEIVAQAKQRDILAYQQLIKLYVKHGLYKEHLVSLTKKGMDGAEEISQMMKNARKFPLTDINGIKVVRVDDYKLSDSKNLVSGSESPIDLPKSNVLVYHTEDGSQIALRPSGTEPKIKFYMSVNCPLPSASKFEEISEQLDKKIINIVEDLKL
ncbi:hypothetical protein GCM10022396_40420 [Flavivirga amylovorans]